MKNQLRFLMLAAVAVSTLLALPAKAAVVTPYHWPYGNPAAVSVYIAPSIPGAWIGPFAHAMSVWNQSSSKFRFTAGGSGHDVTLQYLWFNSALAVTTTRVDGRNLVYDCDTAFNSKYSWDVNGVANKYDAWSTMTHELGHWLTLGDEYNSWEYWNTMYYAANPGDTFRRSLEADDINGIRAIYGS